MNNYKFVFIFLLIVLPFFDAPQANPLVIQNVRVLNMDSNEILSGQTIIIKNGLIDWTGSDADARLPDDANIITGDYYVMPGLAEMHAHIPGRHRGEEYIHDVLALYLSQGITTVRNMAGNPVHLEIRERVKNGEVPGPRIYTAGPSFGGAITDPNAGRDRVREQAEAGFDLLKFSPGLSLEVFEALVDEAHSQDIEFSGHISYDVGLVRSLEAGKGSIDHLDRYMEFLAGEAANRPDPPVIYFGYDLTHQIDEAKIDEAARLTAEAGVWNVPTNTLLENVFNPELSVETMAEWPGMEYIPADMVENWKERVRSIRAEEDYDPETARRFLEIRKQLTYALHRQGAGLMLGADAPQIFNPPGYSAHRELEVLVDAGLNPYAALQTGTVNVGVYLGEENLTGKVLPGFRADLILLSRNPLESIPFHDAIEGVIREGRHFDREELDAMLTSMRERLD